MHREHPDINWDCNRVPSSAQSLGKSTMDRIMSAHHYDGGFSSELLLPHSKLIPCTFHVCNPVGITPVDPNALCFREERSVRSQ